jgi:YegS/Rv2252/BmrU family lipid kinase
VNPLLVVNPASAGGHTRGRIESLLDTVRSALGPFECAFTEAPGHAMELARDGALAGSPLVVAVGGDGTASEVAGGLVAAAAAGREASFGFIARGTGGDLQRSLGTDRDVAAAARALAAGVDRRVDVGHVELTTRGGARAARCFVNVAGFGVSGRVDEVAERLGKRLGGKLTYLLAGAGALLGWRDVPVRWRVDGGPWREERITSVSVCNGRFFGGGMLVAPDARLDDRLFDVVAWRGLGLVDLALRRRRLYDGSHVRLPQTEVVRAGTVEAEPVGGERVLLDVDGDPAGTLPARFTLLPGALRVRAPA